MRTCEKIEFDTTADILYVGNGLLFRSGMGTLITSKISFASSPSYEADVKKSQRTFKGLVEIYFDGDDATPTIFEYDDISRISFLDELYTQGETPLGKVSSNELVVGLKNLLGVFRPENTASPYYGKLLPNLLIVAYFGLELTSGVFDWIRLGKFRTGDWVAPASSLECELVCYDFLYNIINDPMPQIPCQEKKTKKEMIEILLKAAGKTSNEIDISDALDYAVPLGWFVSGEIRDGLQPLAEGSSANIFGDREGIIKAVSNYTTKDASIIWRDSDMIYNAEMPQKYNNAYSQVEVKYYIPKIANVSSLLKLENVTVPSAGLTLTDLTFGSPVAFIDEVRLTNATNVTITSIATGSWGITIVLANAGVEKEVTLEIFGHIIETTEAYYTATDTTMQGKIGNVVLKIDNYLIQTEEDAIEYAEDLLPIVADPSAYVTIDGRGDPSVLLTDTINIINTTEDIDDLDVVPIRQEYIYDGALTCKSVAIKRSAKAGA